MPLSAYDAAIGALVRDAREDAGITQDELATRVSIEAGISWRQTTVYKVEGGRRTMSAAELWAVAQALTGGDMNRVLRPSPMKRAQAEAQAAAGTRDAAKQKARGQLDRWSERADATTKAARALGTNPHGLETLANQLWQTSFYAERARRLHVRLERMPELTTADAELKRQVSRQMLRELRRKQAE